MSIMVEEWRPMRQSYLMSSLVFTQMLPIYTVAAFGIFLVLIQKAFHTDHSYARKAFVLFGFFLFLALFALTTGFAVLPMSTMAASGQILALIHKVLAIKYFYIETIFWFFSIAFFLGLFAFISDFKKEFRIGIMFCFFVIYILFSYYFKSLYEEAVILALSPWLLLAFHQSYSRKNHLPLMAIGSLILLAKSQMIFLLPIFLGLLFRKLASEKQEVRIVVAIVGATFFLVIGASIGKDRLAGLELQNAYNRFFNGIGWSLQGVADWPGKTVSDKNQFFNANSKSIQDITKYLEPLEERRLLGTFFWPEGAAILYGTQNHVNNDEITIRQKVHEKISYRNFVLFFFDHPTAILAYVKGSYGVAISSDYNLNYLKTSSKEETLINRIIAPPLRLVTENFGFYFFAAGLLTMAFASSLYWRICTFYYFFGATLFVVLGDGYMEFEKHMVPYFMLMPSIILPAILFDRCSWIRPREALIFESVDTPTTEINPPRLTPGQKVLGYSYHANVTCRSVHAWNLNLDSRKPFSRVERNQHQEC